MNVEFFKHNITEKDIKRAVKVLHSLFLTTGSEVREFEELFAGYLGCKNAIGVTSGTAALHLSLIALGIGPGDEVITTPMTFVATATAVMQAGAVPVFVDVERNTGNMNADLIEPAITARTRAIMPVHLYGQMCDMRKIKEIADRRGLCIIEDAAHCIEGERDGIRPGSLSDTACFSFYATKSLTSGEGGAVIANNDAVAEKIRRLRMHGIDKGAEERYRIGKYKHWDMKNFGWKYNMDNIQGALLINQIRKLDILWKKRYARYKRYITLFRNVNGINFPEIIGKSALHLFTVWVDPKRRDAILQAMQEKGVGIAVNYQAIHNLTYFKDRWRYKPSDFSRADVIGKSTISLPFYPKLTMNEQTYVVNAMRSILES